MLLALAREKRKFASPWDIYLSIQNEISCFTNSVSGVCDMVHGYRINWQNTVLSGLCQKVQASRLPPQEQACMPTDTLNL